MAVKPILRMGHPVLRVPAAPYPVSEFDTPEFAALIQDLRDTLVDAGGIGLAAPQIGVSYQVVIVDIPAGPSRYGELSALGFSVFINPKLTPLSTEKQSYWEGCLSVPGLRGLVSRPSVVQIDYLSDESVNQRRTFTGFPATVIQHELDHLTGTLYIDHIEDRSLIAFESEYETFHSASTPPTGI